MDADSFADLKMLQNHNLLTALQFFVLKTGINKISSKTSNYLCISLGANSNTFFKFLP